MNALFSKRSIQLTGLLMWRTGLMVAGATGLYRTSKFLLQFFDLPLQLEIGFGLLFSGSVIFMVSLIAERLMDAKTEADLSQ